MTRIVRDVASERQVEAADPRGSTWLSANAGSGKTRVLTDRVARLLLDGVPPQNVLCLTYTKAAASEMQNRLFRRLGHWAMEEDAALAEDLARLGADTAPSPARLAEARRLFARAIETPGGLKIQTIHSFCGALLRRFPVEAGVTPGFVEMDEVAAARLQAQIISELADHAPERVRAVAPLVSDEDFGALAAAILRHRTRFPAVPCRDTVCAHYGLDPAATAASLKEAALGGIDQTDLAAIATTVSALSGKGNVKLAEIVGGLADHGMTDALFEAAASDWLYSATNKEGRGGQPKERAISKPARTALGPHLATLEALMGGVAHAADQLKALDDVEKTYAIQGFAAAFLPAYAEAKETRGLLDFDDLIARTHALLSAEGQASWVLYRLDGGIDHLLVDEAQDTSPLQWEVIDLLTREFTSGDGTRQAGARTVFVVGDVKQSIYSFQGAAPESFDAMRAQFNRRFDQVGAPFVGLELEHSFRSAPDILRLVDLIFHEGNRAGLGTTVMHRAGKHDLPGRVELWPRIEADATQETGQWFDPVDLQGREHHSTRLAEDVADAAQTMIAEGQLTGTDGNPRPVQAGDILILVQRRSQLFHEVIRACKARGIEVAGADVLKLGEELAVKDLLAVLRYLDTPEDDLSLAAALRSPLFGWSEADLYDLAHGRGRAFLWETLRAARDRYPETLATLDDLRTRAEFLRPYDLLDRILTRHEGRTRLIARLGAEAEDGIDALLARALAYERGEPPTLTGFLAEQEAVSTDVKRQAEGRGTKLRVMTVHGAKGLESPIVILPDCGLQRRLRQYTDPLIADGAGQTLWAASKATAPASVTRLRDAAVAKRVEESRRLLYVALTRAEQWLVVAAAGELGSHGDSWYEQVRHGMEEAGADVHPGLGQGGLLLQSPLWPSASGEREDRAPAPDGPALPAWAQVPVPAPQRPAQSLSPSGLGGTKALPGPAGLPEEAATDRGTRLHLMLQHLPGCATKNRTALAAALLAPQPVRSEELAEAAALIDAPHLAALFAGDALAEVPFSATLAELDGRRVEGVIDRLVISTTRILAVDYKSNATVPTQAADVPDGLLRQMGAYAAALRQIYPDRPVEVALLWTRTATLMPLPDDLISAALERARRALATRPPSPADRDAHDIVTGA